MRIERLERSRAEIDKKEELDRETLLPKYWISLEDDDAVDASKRSPKRNKGVKQGLDQDDQALREIEESSKRYKDRMVTGKIKQSWIEKWEERDYQRSDSDEERKAKRKDRSKNLDSERKRKIEERKTEERKMEDKRE